MTTSSSLVRVLLGLVIQHDWFFESCDDSTLDPDDAVKQMEWSAHVLGQLSEADRRTLVTIVAELAAEEIDPGLQEFIASYPENMGLIDPES